MPSPIMAPAISRSMMQASEVPAATSFRASAWLWTGVTVHPASLAWASPAEPLSTAKVRTDRLSLVWYPAALSAGTTTTWAFLQ